MWYVYILRSRSHPTQEYTGISEDLRQRLNDHNAGKSPHTSKYRPWNMLWYCAFPDKMCALALEKYLKSHTGQAFAKKRLLPNCDRSNHKDRNSNLGLESEPASTPRSPPLRIG